MLKALLANQDPSFIPYRPRRLRAKKRGGKKQQNKRQAQQPSQAQQTQQAQQVQQSSQPQQQQLPKREDPRLTRKRPRLSSVGSQEMQLPAMQLQSQQQAQPGALQQLQQHYASPSTPQQQPQQRAVPSQQSQQPQQLQQQQAVQTQQRQQTVQRKQQQTVQLQQQQQTVQKQSRNDARHLLNTALQQQMRHKPIGELMGAKGDPLSRSQAVEILRTKKKRKSKVTCPSQEPATPRSRDSSADSLGSNGSRISQRNAASGRAASGVSRTPSPVPPLLSPMLSPTPSPTGRGRTPVPSPRAASSRTPSPYLTGHSRTPVPSPRAGRTPSPSHTHTNTQLSSRNMHSSTHTHTSRHTTPTPSPTLTDTQRSDLVPFRLDFASPLHDPSAEQQQEEMQQQQQQQGGEGSEVELRLSPLSQGLSMLSGFDSSIPPPMPGTPVASPRGPGRRGSHGSPSYFLLDPTPSPTPSPTSPGPSPAVTRSRKSQKPSRKVLQEDARTSYSYGGVRSRDGRSSSTSSERRHVQ